MKIRRNKLYYLVAFLAIIWLCFLLFTCGGGGGGGGSSDSGGGGGSDSSDTIPPVRSNGQPSGVLAAGTTQMIMSLTTNENATCKYSATSGIPYSSMVDIFSLTGSTSHSASLSGLQDGKDYSYYIKCADGTGNANNDDFTISFSISPVVTGNVYYVATNGSDSNNGSIGSPWATVQYAGRTARPGDTVLVRGGTYNEGEIWLRADYGHCGTPGRLLIIKAYPGETPLFVNANRPFIVECDHIRLEGLHFRNGKDVSIRGLNRTAIQIVNNTFMGSGYAWDAIGTNGNNILLEGNVCDISGNTVGTQGHCYYIAHGTNIIVRNNVAKGMTGYGIHVFDQRRSEDPSGFERLIKDVIIEGNIVSNSQQRSGIILAAYDHARIENVMIRNNIVFNNADNGIYVPGIASNLKVYNNTVFGNRGSAAFFTNANSTDVNGVVIKNNIFDITGQIGTWGFAHHVVNQYSNPTVALENNLYWPTPPKLYNISDPSPKTGNPLFVNPSIQDFHLQSGSAAIDKGLALTDVPTDKDGIRRPVGSAYDIGAYEFH